MAVLRGGGDAGGILERRDQVEKLRLLFGAQRLFQDCKIDAVRAQRYADGPCAIGTESVQCADEARILADHRVSLIAERFARQLDALLSAGGDDRLVKLASDAEFFKNARGNRLPQRCVALRDAVLERVGGIGGKNVRGDLRQCLDGEGQRIRIARRKADDGRVGQGFEDLPDRGRLEGG